MFLFSKKMFFSSKVCLILSVILMVWFNLFTIVDSGPVAGAICSAGCAALVVACYAAGGATFGQVTGII